MTLNVATAAKLFGLANRIIKQHNVEIKAILSEIVGDDIAPTPTPTPTDPRVSLPPDFDEQFYLERYQDIRDAVAAKKITSGAEHYVTWGWKEGREYKRQAGPVAPPAPPWEPADAYQSIGALRDDLAIHKFSGAVKVDGARVHDGFGPALDYFVARDGRVLRGKRSAPLNEYASIDALKAHLSEIDFKAVVFVDGVAVNSGFVESHSPCYVSKDGRIKRQL